MLNMDRKFAKRSADPVRIATQSRRDAQGSRDEGIQKVDPSGGAAREEVSQIKVARTNMPVAQRETEEQVFDLTGGSLH